MGRATVRAPMPASRRAKQFAPFQALKGLNEAIAEKERMPTPRRTLAEDALAELNQTLSRLHKGSSVTVIFYCMIAQEYQQITGSIEKLDTYHNLLHIGNMAIDFSDIERIEIFPEPV